MSTNFFLDRLKIIQGVLKIKNFKVESVEKIPVRATLFSAILSLPYVIGLIRSSSNNIYYPERVRNMKIALTMILTIRCPLTVLVTFASNRKPY